MVTDSCLRSYSAAPTTSTSGAGTPTTTGSTGSTCTSVAVTFDETVTTTYGETVKISGSIPVLGNWDTSEAVALSADQYTASNPLWEGTINISPGTSFEYKLIKLETDGSVTWQSGNNQGMWLSSACLSLEGTRTNDYCLIEYTVPTSPCTATVTGSW